MVNILLGVSGSVATIKAAQIVSLIKNADSSCEVRVITTEHATHFLDMEELENLKVKVRLVFGITFFEKIISF